MKTILLAATFFCFLNFINGQAGRLDPSFGTNGVVKADLGKSYGFPVSANQVLTQDDGSIFLIISAATQFNDYYDQGFILKRHPDGSIDSSYGQNGFSDNIAVTPSTAILQQDGKIIVGGSVGEYPYGSVTLTRFNANGSRDSSFGNGGTQNVFAFVAVLQYNEKIVVCSNSYIARYNNDGSPDSSFNGGSIQTDGFGINDAAIQSDGKIVVAGNLYDYSSDSSVYIVARYNTDGSADSSFGNNGKQITRFNSKGDLPNAIVIQKDGKILVGGASLVQYNTDGSIDSSFSGDGIVTTDFKVIYGLDQGYSINLQSDGKIVVAGMTGSENAPDFTIARYNTDGSIDNTFSGDGRLTNDFKTNSVVIQKDNKILVAGSVSPDFVVVRYTANGSSDDTFGKNGNVTGNIKSGNTIYENSAFQKDGKLLTTGRTWNGSYFDAIIVRHNADGSLDNTFGDSGIQKTDFGASAIAVQSDGKIVIAGSENNDFSVARYNADGSTDNTFGGDGKVQTDFDNKGDGASAVAIQADGKIVAAGVATVLTTSFPENFEYSAFGVTRYNTDGSLDNTFDADGKKSFAFPDGYGDIYGSYAASVAIQKDGKIVVVGVSSGDGSFISVARLNADGNRDTSFIDDLQTSVPIGVAPSSLSVAIQDDGKVVVGGYSYYRGTNYNFVSRFNTNGSQDKSFGGNGDASTGYGADSYPYNYSGKFVVAIQPDGKIVVAGVALTRYNTNGNLDSSFGTNGIEIKNVAGNNIYINSILISDNKLYGIGSGKLPGYVGVIARYLLDNSGPTPPTVSLTAPSDNATYLAPVNLQLAATAADADGTIAKVEFYNDSTLLYTDTIAPYSFTLKNTPVGSYILTAKATDNSGLATISARVHVLVVPNRAPTVSITNPVNNRTFAAPAYIHFEAEASDPNGRITRVDFYSDSILLATEYKAPYKFVWKNLPVGIYTITAVATDNFGAQTTSAPVTVKVKSLNTSIVSSKPNAETNLFDTETVVSIKAFPNPAGKMLTVSTIGLQQNRPTTISILSATGVIIKTLRVSNSTTQLDVSSLTSGVYTIKLLSGDKVLYKQFVKL